ATTKQAQAAVTTAAMRRLVFLLSCFISITSFPCSIAWSVRSLSPAGAGISRSRLSSWRYFIPVLLQLVFESFAGTVQPGTHGRRPAAGQRRDLFGAIALNII